MAEQIDPPDRNFVRHLLKYAQMDNPTEDQIALLHGCLARRLIEFGGMRDTYRIGEIKGRSVRVKSDYFDGREGVTFSADGFVGFAGWADATNILPILWGVIDWVREVSGFDASNCTLQDLEAPKGRGE